MINNCKYIKKYCTGCGLCHELYNYNISAGNKGFPEICINDTVKIENLREICPVFYYHKKNCEGLWGHIKRSVVGYSSNRRIRHKASSGGALTEICLYLIHHRLVNGIIHIAPDPDDQTKTITCVSYTDEEIIDRSGSRYSISVPLYNLSQLLKKEEKYAFVGKPCDVMALRQAMYTNIELKDRIVILLSFFCAGEPSDNAQVRLLNAVGIKKEEIATLTYRGNGWPGKTQITDINGRVLELDYKEAWGKYLGRDIRMICHFCMDGIGEAADIVCADFWYLNNRGVPDFSEHDGRNIIIARTELGYETINNIIDEGCLIVEDDFTDRIDTELQYYQPAQYKRKCTMGSMIKAMHTLGQVAPRYNKNSLYYLSRNINIKTRFRYYFGTLKRILQKKI